MERIIYSSQRTDDFSVTQIIEMLRSAQESNYNSGISGLLVYGNDRFLQVIEGIEAPLRSLYKKIEEDKRHHSLKVLGKDEVEIATFNLWRMLFINLDNLGLGRGGGKTAGDFFPEEMTKEQALGFMVSIGNYLESKTDAISSERKTVAFCDDDSTMLKLMEIYLRDQPFDLKLYESGELLLEDYDNLKPDLVISDIDMPGRDGLEVLKEVRSRDFYVPLLFSTSRQLDDRLENALTKGADGYILKPYKRNELLTAIHQAILSASLIKSEVLNF